MDYGPSLIGLLVGLVVGATSTGGGALLTPALVLIARVPVATAIGSDVLIASGMKLFGRRASTRCAARCTGRRSAGWRPGRSPARVAGIWLLNRIPAAAIDAWLAPALGIVLIAGRRGDHPPSHRRPRQPPAPRAAAARHRAGRPGDRAARQHDQHRQRIDPAVRARALLPAERHHDRRHGPGARPWWSRRSPRWATPSRDASTWRWPRRCLSGPCRGVMVGARIATAIPERMLRAGLAAVLIAIGLQMAIFATPPAHAETAAPAAQEGNRSWTTSP